jgi:hypothetical protein
VTTRFAALAIAITSVIAVAGCGLGAGSGTSDVTVTVTRDFGSRAIAQRTAAHVPGSETVMRMLERDFNVTTRYGGGFVQSIDGHSGSSSRRDWFYYVNGIEAPHGAAGTAVHHGDRVWWDLHDWSATNSIPAVVGSFPEPFVHGSAGKRLPTALECAPDASSACEVVSTELTRIGVPVASQTIGTGSGTDSLAVEVGTWQDLRGQIVASLIDQGPGSSGVYARFRGDSLELLDPHGRAVRTLGAGAGLVAATSQASSEPTWLVTGTDAAGVNAAAQALTPTKLGNRFAIAVQGGSTIALPLDAGT